MAQFENQANDEINVVKSTWKSHLSVEHIMGVRKAHPSSLRRALSLALIQNPPNTSSPSP